MSAANELNRITEQIIEAAVEFNVPVLRQGIRRLVNNFPEAGSPGRAR